MDDIRGMIANLEKSYRKEFQEVRGEIFHLITHLDVSEAVAASVETRLTNLERAATRQSLSRCSSKYKIRRIVAAGTI